MIEEKDIIASIMSSDFCQIKDPSIVVSPITVKIKVVYQQIIYWSSRSEQRIYRP